MSRKTPSKARSTLEGQGQQGVVTAILGRRVTVKDAVGSRACFLSGQRAVVGDRVRWVEASGEGGKLVSVEAEQLTMEVAEKDRLVPHSAIWQVVLPPAASRPVRPLFWLHLTNGDRWGVSSVQLTDEELEFQLASDNSSPHPRKLAIGLVAGIQPLRPGTSWKTDDSEWRQVASRRVKSDLVVLQNGDHPVGEVNAISASGLGIAGSLGQHEIEWGAVAGLLMNPDLTETSKPIAACAIPCAR